MSKAKETASVSIQITKGRLGHAAAGHEGPGDTGHGRGWFTYCLFCL